MTHSQQNISSRDAYARFMLGSVLTTFGTIRLMRDPKSRSGQMLVLLGSMKTAEGATKFCPKKAMSSLLSSSNLDQKMMGGNASQGAGATMNSATQTGQMGGSLMQMVGNIAQKFTGGNTSQSTNGTQSTSSGAGQNTAGSNIAQTLGSMAQQMTSGTAAQTIGNIAQTVAPQVNQILSDVAGMTGSQNASGTNTTGKQTSAASGTNTKATTNENTNTKNALNGTKNANANSDSTNSTSTSKNSGNNMQKAEATKSQDGAANIDNLSTVGAAILNASSKANNKNTSSTNILQ